MDRRTDWPWSSEEEAEWKAELEERDYEFLEELIESAVDGAITSSRYVFGAPQEEEATAAGAPERFSVTA